MDLAKIYIPPDKSGAIQIRGNSDFELPHGFSLWDKGMKYKIWL